MQTSDRPAGRHSHRTTTDTMATHISSKMEPGVCSHGEETAHFFLSRILSQPVWEELGWCDHETRMMKRSEGRAIKFLHTHNLCSSHFLLAFARFFLNLNMANMSIFPPIHLPETVFE